MSAVAHIDTYKTGEFFKDSFRGEMSWNGYENNVLLLNRGLDRSGNPSYTDIAPAIGADDILDARGIAIFDYDRDGDLDVAVNHNPGDSGRESVPAVLLENNMARRGHWLAVELEGVQANRDAVGTSVRVSAGTRTWLRHVTAGGSYAGQHGHTLYFGLGSDVTEVALEVQWAGPGPSASPTRFEKVPVDGWIRLKQGRNWEPQAYPVPRAASQMQGE